LDVGSVSGLGPQGRPLLVRLQLLHDRVNRLQSLLVFTQVSFATCRPRCVDCP
jgi:hypothetical protein